MPWSTPTLKQTRGLTRDYVLSQLGAKAMIPNSALRIMSDAMAGTGQLAYLYLDWLAKQLMPDTAEQVWLDRFGIIWLVNADGSKGRKAATYAQGNVLFQGDSPTIIPIGSLLVGATGVQYQTITAGNIDDSGQGSSSAVALTAGAIANLSDGDAIAVSPAILGVSGASAMGDFIGGIDQETDDQLRERILFRIQEPPMGGNEQDYVRWAMAVPGVTRAWAASEMGIGTMSVRFLMDDLYPDNYGLPTPADVQTVSDYIDSVRPVTVKDCFVMAPLLYFYDITINKLSQDTPTVRGNIEASLEKMELTRSQPGQTMFRSWVDEAISQAIGEVQHELTFTTVVMPGLGYMPTLGTIIYVA